MRRIAVVIVLALVGAVWLGAYGPSDGVTVNSNSISADQLNSELRLIATTPNFSCYLATKINLGTGGNDTFMSPTASASWTQTRVSGLGIEDYMVRAYKWQPTPSELAAAKQSYIDELTNAATASNTSCPVSAEVALNEMPAWFVNDQVLATAASQAFAASLPGAFTLDAAGAKAYYDANPSNYDTICIVAAEVPASYYAAFEADRKAGASVEALARKYSVDASASKGGHLGCYAPGSGAYSTVRNYTSGTPLNHYPTNPQVQSVSGQQYLIYVAPIKRTHNSLDASINQVAIDMKAHNATIAQSAETDLVRASVVLIDPAYAVWSKVQAQTVPLVTPKAGTFPPAATGA